MNIDDFQSEISLAGGATAPNLWNVKLPSLGDFDTRGLNLLCTGTNTPARSLSQTEYRVGLNKAQVVNDFGIAPIQMSFLCVNDGRIFSYFETWQNLALDQGSYEVGYYEDYVYDIQIEVLKKGFAQSLFKKQFKLPLPSNIKNRLPNIGPINFRQGEVDFQLKTKEEKIITYTLMDAYPSAVQGIQLNNDPLSAFVEIQVEFSYRNFYSDLGVKAGQGDIFGKAINKLTDKLFDKLGI